MNLTNQEQRTNRVLDILGEDTETVESAECEFCGAFSGEHRDIPQDEYDFEGALVGVGTLSRKCPNA